jgi:hypothetical protein
MPAPRISNQTQLCVWLHELHALASAFAELRSAFALVDNAWFFKVTPVAHFDQNPVTLHDLIEPPQCRLKRLIVIDDYASHKYITYFLAN